MDVPGRFIFKMSPQVVFYFTSQKSLAYSEAQHVTEGSCLPREPIRDGFLYNRYWRGWVHAVWPLRKP